ncbi:hypothetical protein FQA39_LY03715 [Lamprigera yunnana]|nr:hypothetical protein FQA39_LY03715 [Lamprigera yunnana]
MGSFIELFICLRVYFDRLIDFIFGLCYDNRRQNLPAPSDPLVYESATSLVQKIKTRSITCENVVKIFINRIKEVNRYINAVVDNRFEEALNEAKAIDEDLKNGILSDNDFEKKPFLGIPFTTKETTACKGLRNTFGLVSRKHIIAEEDADMVALMKSAGGILLGVTNMPQLNMWQESHNPIYGRTNNPYNTVRNSGGSSGGDCAIVAAGGSALGIGTDIGGSIRIPAFMCGVFGHKPTTGLISTKGFTYRTGKERVTMMTAGTITRRANDIIPFLKVLLNKNVDKLKLDQNVTVKNLQIYYALETKDYKISSSTKEMKQSIFKVLKHFEESSGNFPQKLNVPEIKFGGELWRYWMRQEDNSCFARDFNNRIGKVNGFLELFKFCFGRSDFNLGAIFTLINDFLPVKSKRWAESTTKELCEKLQSKLGEDGVLIYPSAPWTASYHCTSYLRPWNFNYFAIWNALKFPVTQVPIGLDSNGLPLGIQIVAAPFQDHLCIAVAKELETTFGGYVPPP